MRWIGYNAVMDRSGMRYTLIFLTHGDLVLMLHRRKPPNQGLWNGIGGRIEPAESPLDCALREVLEETGFRLEALRFAGILTWDGFEIQTPAGGLYLYTAAAPDGEARENGEGDLAWKSRQWVLTDPGVVSNIHVFGPLVLDGSSPREYYFHYREREILYSEIRDLPSWATEFAVSSGSS